MNLYILHHGLRVEIETWNTDCQSGSSSRIEEVADQDHHEHHLVKMRLIVRGIARVQIFIKNWQIIGCKQHWNDHPSSIIIESGIFQKFLSLMNLINNVGKLHPPSTLFWSLQQEYTFLSSDWAEIWTWPLIIVCMINHLKSSLDTIDPIWKSPIKSRPRIMDYGRGLKALVRGPHQKVGLESTASIIN